MKKRLALIMATAMIASALSGTVAFASEADDTAAAAEETKDDAAAAILNVLAESNTASMASSELRAAVIQETGCSQRTYERAYRSLIESGEIAKFQLNQPGGIRGWFTRLCYQSEADGEVTE